MLELVNKLASDTGLDPGQVEKGLGALLAFLKEHLGDDILAKLQEILPNAHDLAAKHEREALQAAAPGGVLGKLTSLASSLFGARAEEATKLLAKFTQAGFSADQMSAFLPRALELIEKYLPPEVFAKIKALIPGAAPAATASK